MGESWFRKEFLTPRRLAFNVIWYGLQLFMFAYGWYSQVRLHYPRRNHNILSLFVQQTNQKLATLNGLGFSVWISRGAGLVLALDGGMIIVPMLRNVIRVVRPKVTWLFPADENIWFHRQVAYSMAFWAMVHTTAHYVNFINVERSRTFQRFYNPIQIIKIYLRRGAQSHCPRYSLHASWRHHWPLHAPNYGHHVHYFTPQNPSTMF